MALSTLHEGIKPGTVIRYVGNRFNVLIYLAGSFIIYKTCVTANKVCSVNTARINFLIQGLGER